MLIPDRPSVRRANLLQLFSEFVSTRMAQSPSQQINGLDREFAALIQVHNTYFSGMKSGARTIGDKLARQIEVLCSKAKGWMDEAHVTQETPAADNATQSAELLAFLDMAERAYAAAPGSRAKLVKMMCDVLKRQEKNIS
ncbi:MAG: hypothetical protein PHP05_00115 [Sideroxydans sp.]|nr:hypothetical protein [Sideroxydans sp.]